jgi:hypothetical protein
MGKFKDIDLTVKTIKQFPDLKKKFKKGVISTIESPAKKFVDIRSRVKKAGGYAMGGEASEGVARAGIRKGIRDRKRKELMDSLDRLKRKGPRIKPKRKPKKDTPRPKKPSLDSLDLSFDSPGLKSSDEIKALIEILKKQLK